MVRQHPSYLVAVCEQSSLAVLPLQVFMDNEAASYLFHSFHAELTFKIDEKPRWWNYGPGGGGGRGAPILLNVDNFHLVPCMIFFFFWIPLTENYHTRHWKLVVAPQQLRYMYIIIIPDQGGVCECGGILPLTLSFRSPFMYLITTMKKVSRLELYLCIT